MANILDQMADALTEAGQTVGTKLKETKDITALKAKLHSHEKTLNKAYLQLGKDYYNAHKDDAENASNETFKTIEKEIKEVNELKACIDNIKN
ncbi:MAG: hypothetical protein K6D02_04435 [Lachnospiraceae bacterium]|nr:hypothetical protein [Lachnospiraceae bacterium]